MEAKPSESAAAPPLAFPSADLSSVAAAVGGSPDKFGGASSFSARGDVVFRVSAKVWLTVEGEGRTSEEAIEEALDTAAHLLQTRLTVDPLHQITDMRVEEPWCIDHDLKVEEG